MDPVNNPTSMHIWVKAGELSCLRNRVNKIKISRDKQIEEKIREKEMVLGFDQNLLCACMKCSNNKKNKDR